MLAKIIEVMKEFYNNSLPLEVDESGYYFKTKLDIQRYRYTHGI